MHLDFIAKSLEKNPSLYSKQWDWPGVNGTQIKTGSDINGLNLDIDINYFHLPRRHLWATAGAEVTASNKVSSRGYGTRVWLSRAIKVAFAEAWERFLLNLLTEDKPTHGPSVPLAFLSKPDAFKMAVKQQGLPIAQTPWPGGKSSNGFAAGGTLFDAATSAAAELFERHCVLSAWNKESQVTRFKIRPPFWLAPATSKGWQFDWFIFGRCQYFTTVGCLARHPSFGARFDAAAKIDIKEAALAAAVCVQRMIFSIDAKTLDFDELWRQGDPLSHLAYYADPKNLGAFDFLFQSENDPPVRAAGFEPTIIPLWIGGALPAVARACCEGAKDIEWGERSLKSLSRNSSPHPIA